MKQIKLLLTTVIALCTTAAFAQKGGNSLLWEISGNGLKESSYLYGTIHLIDKNDFVVRPAIDSVFGLCTRVAFEIDMDDIEQLMGIEPWLKLPVGVTLQSLCTPEQFETIKKYFADSLGTDIMVFNNYKPFVLYQQIVSTFIKGETESFELYFVTKSMQAAKDVVGLEAVADQLQIFDLIPYEEQISWIVGGIQSAKDYQVTWEELIAAYKAEDIKKLKKLTNESSPELTKYDDAFLIDRNMKWIPVIDKLVQEKSTFIAVGAAHLIGKKGVIRLLKKQGYTVKPIY